MPLSKISGTLEINKEVVFREEDSENEDTNEAMCSSSVQCVLYFLNFGLTEGNVGMPAISYRDNTNFYFNNIIIFIMFF